jgi:hypothetical protein
VDDLLNQLSSKFSTMSSELISKSTCPFRSDSTAQDRMLTCHSSGRDVKTTRQPGSQHTSRQRASGFRFRQMNRYTTGIGEERFGFKQGAGGVSRSYCTALLLVHSSPQARSVLPRAGVSSRLPRTRLLRLRTSSILAPTALLIRYLPTSLSLHNFRCRGSFRNSCCTLLGPLV